jgi:hypothetical protein
MVHIYQNLSCESEDNSRLILGYIQKSRYEKMSAMAFFTVYQTDEQKATSPLTNGS